MSGVDERPNETGEMEGDAWTPVLRTLETMLKDRNYTHFKSLSHGDDPVLLCSCRDAKGEPTFVFLSHETKVGVKALRKIRQDSAASGSKHIILVSADGLTPFASRELNEMEGFDIEIFRRHELRFPVTHHRLVPLHTPLTKAQKAQLVAELGGRASCLPKLKETDPVARYLHLSPGTVVKITRRIGSMEAEPYFRIVG
jgi:DNA-directed RNA polymerase subunit H (RpoH/RPB5)